MHDRYGNATSFLESVRETCSRHLITQAELAQRIGCHPITVNRWFGGTQVPDVLHMLLLDAAIEEVMTEREANIEKINREIEELVDHD